jgi:hypothetical protein
MIELSEDDLLKLFKDVKQKLAQTWVSSENCRISLKKSKTIKDDGNFL